MARPENKQQLLELSNRYFDRLIDYINLLPLQEQTAEFAPGTLNRNIRDVLAHLHHWHLMFLGWYSVGMKGQKPAMPAEGHTWKMTPELNAFIRDQYTDKSFRDVMILLRRSHLEARKLIEQHSNKELFDKGYYNWTGTTSLGAYLISATSSHYDWAYKLIRRCLR